MSADGSMQSVTRLKPPLFQWTEARAILIAIKGILFAALFSIMVIYYGANKPAFFVALLFTGGISMVSGRWLEKTIEKIISGIDPRKAAINAIDHLLRIRSTSEIEALWRQTLQTIFLPTKISNVVGPIAVAQLKNDRHALLVPDLYGGAFLLEDPRRLLRLFTWRDVELSQKLWEIFAKVQRSLNEFSEGQASERRYIAEQIRSDLEWPLQRAMQEAEAVPYRALFERAHAELVDVRNALIGDAMTIGQLYFAIEVECRQRFSETGITFRSDDLSNGAHFQIDAFRTISIRRILREAATNIIRHAQAQQVTLTVEWDESKNILALMLTDDGVGFDALDDHNGRGLNNMRRRASEMDADIEWQAQAPKGMQMKLCLCL